MSRVEVVEVGCPACGSSTPRRLFGVSDYSNPEFEERFGVCRCRLCGCGYLSPRPLAGDIHRYYGPWFYWSWEGGAKLSRSEALALRAPQVAAKQKRLADLAPGRLLDIGAMKGEFVFAMRELGWDAEGFDFSQVPENLFDVPMQYGDFLDAAYEDESFDCVTMWAVLEHVYEPASYVEKISRLLKPGGRFVALVTNFNSIQGRVLRQDDFPRHMTFFTKRSLARMLRASGLEPTELSTSQDIFSSPLNGWLVHGLKLLGGYSQDEVLYERRSSDKDAFCCKWRGRRSTLMRFASRLDLVVSFIPERALDHMRMGHILTVIAHKRRP